MATTAKPQKDKPHGLRIAPRPTTASAARAARNATNRNLNLQPSQRTSPTRVPPASPNLKKHTPSRPIQKTDSKVDTKANANANSDIPPPAKSEADTYIIDNVDDSKDIVEEPTDMTNAEREEYNPLNSDTFVSSVDIKDSEENLNLVSPLTQIPPESGSRPHTPVFGSRPQTPKSVSSRPQTPRIRSRPSTPAQSSQRKLTTTPTSRPTTPQRASPLSRPKTPSALPVPIGHISSPTTACPVVRSPAKEEDLKTLLTTKQKQFQSMKKELDMKQQALLEFFDSIRKLNDQLAQEGEACPEGAPINELVVFNVGDWTADEVAQLCRDAAAASNSNENALDVLNSLKDIDEKTLSELDSKVAKVPSTFADLCLQAFTARQELIDWIKELIGQVEDGRGESLDRIARYNAQGLELCETLRELKSRADDAVDSVTHISRQAYRERSALMAVGESLVREIARLRQDLEARAVIVHEMREIRAETDTCKVLEETSLKLEEEKTARLAAKDKLATTESQLRQARIRVAKMDRQLREAEASIASLTGTVKSLEDQSRLREVQLEARARKLKESLKTGEVTSNQIAQQRDALQNEVQTLKEQIENLNTQHKNAVLEFNKEIKELKAVLEEQRQEYLKEADLRKSLENNLSDSERMVEELKAKITELENSRPNPELPTEREMDLWAELQATKDTLRMTEDEVTACKREKVRFLETLTKISESENKVGMQQKLAAELLSKEEIIGKMQIQIRELTKNIKLNEQKVSQYEQYVRDLQAHNRAVANCQEAPNGISYQDLQQEIMNLRMNLLDAVHRNEELSEILVQKEQQLEQQDKTSRAQARVIKVNKQIAAKAEEIQELFATLENKQQQIHRLEKIVLALEEQQKRAQAQRTRHEEKIAALEHELAAGNRRERKFIFF